MLHTLWTYSLFCVWGWTVQEEPLPWSNIGATGPTRWGPGDWGCMGALSDGTSPAQGSSHLRLQSSWVCVWGSKASGATARTNSQAELCTCRLLNTQKLDPLMISGWLGEWWSHAMDWCELKCQGCICWTGRKVGSDTFLSHVLLLGSVLVLRALLWWYSWVFHWSQHDQFVWETLIWETLQACILNNFIKKMLFVGVL